MTDDPGRAAAVLERLARLPRLPVFLGVLAFGLAAFFTPGIIGAVLVGVLTAGTVALTALTWNHRTPGERAVRLLVFGILVLMFLSKLW